MKNITRSGMGFQKCKNRLVAQGARLAVAAFMGAAAPAEAQNQIPGLPPAPARPTPERSTEQPRLPPPPRCIGSYQFMEAMEIRPTEINFSSSNMNAEQLEALFTIEADFEQTGIKSFGLIPYISVAHFTHTGCPDSGERPSVVANRHDISLYFQKLTVLPKGFEEEEFRKAYLKMEKFECAPFEQQWLDDSRKYYNGSIANCPILS